MRSRDGNFAAYKPRMAFLGAGVGLHAEKGELQGMPMLIALIERLALDYDVVLYSLIRVKPESVPQGVRLRQIIKLNLHPYAAYLLLLGKFAIDHFRRPFGIINAISAFPAGRMAVILGKIFSRPVLVHLIGSEIVAMPEIGYGDLLVPRLKKITYWVCQKAGVLILQTTYQKNMLETNLNVTGNTTVLSRRVDSKKFHFRERKISLPVEFIHVASYQPVKDQETLFRAFALISAQVESHLTVIGAGFENPFVKQILADLKIDDKVTCVGIIPHSEVATYLNVAHILLHTSRYESLCGSIQEAMASGVPVCGTRVGILADLGEPYAVIVTPGKPEELAERTLELIRDPSRYVRQQNFAKDYIVTHDADWAAGNYRELFDGWLAFRR